MGMSAIIQSNVSGASSAIADFAQHIADEAAKVQAQAQSVANTVPVVNADIQAHIAVASNPWKTLAIILGALFVVRLVLK